VVGDDERAAAAEADVTAAEVRTALLYLPNIPAEDAPDGSGEQENVEVRRWWPAQTTATPSRHGQSTSVSPLGGRRAALHLGHGARCAAGGLDVPPLPRAGARLLRALTTLALDAHRDAYEEINPPTLVLTETMTSTGHLPKFADEAYHVERDDLWPSDGRGAAHLPPPWRDPRRSAAPAALHRHHPLLPREAGAAAVTPEGCSESTSSRRWSSSPTQRRRRRPAPRPTSWPGPRACCERSASPTECSTCAPATSAPRGAHVRPRGVRAGLGPLARGVLVSWYRDYQTRRANVRYRPAARRTVFADTVNGSALAWARIWAALVECGRQADGSVVLRPCSPRSWRAAGDQRPLTGSPAPGQLVTAPSKR